MDLAPSRENRHRLVRPVGYRPEYGHSGELSADARHPRGLLDRVHERVVAAGGTVLDAPVEYTGPAYGGGYYAVFFADPDGLKLEVVHHAPSNP